MDGSRFGGRLPRLRALPAAVGARVRAALNALNTLRAAGGGALSSARYVLEDGLYIARRVPAGIWGRGRELWLGRDVYLRRRLTALAAALGGVVLVWFVIVPVAPCQLPGGDSCPPGDDAEELIPAGALAYLHANLDPGTDQAERATDLAAELPTLAAETRQLFSAVPGAGLDLGNWFGGEMATALLPRGAGSRSARTVVLLEAEDFADARDFGRELLGSERESDKYRDVGIESSGSEAIALIDGFLVAGEDSAVRRVIDTASGEAPSLAGEVLAREVRDRLPDARLGDAYVSEFGARRMLRPGAGVLSVLEPFVNPAASKAAAAAVALSDEGLELSVVSSQDEDLAEQSPGFFGAFESFEPELPERVDKETYAYLGLGRPAEGARKLISSGAAAPALAPGIEGLARDLQRQGQISLVDQVLPLLGEEASITLGPSGRPSAGAVPYLALLTRGIDEERAGKDLARLQGPIARAVGAAAGGSFEESEIEGATALSLRVSATLELTYAIFDELLVFGSQPDAVAAARTGDPLADSDRFRDAISDLGGAPVALLFADLEGLVELGEQAGLAEDPAYAVFAQDLRRLRGLGLAVSRDGDSLSTRLRLQID